MINKTKTSIAALALSLASLTAQADGPTVSGSLGLDFNSHFMSYGADVWGAGTDPDVLFQPSVGLDFNFGSYGFYTGVWFDVNDQVDSTIGGDIQEVDVWLGTYFSVGDVTVDLTFQHWYYGSETEGIIDVTFSYDTFLAPYIKFHNRIEGVGAQDSGTVLEVGGGYDISDIFSVPFAIGIGLTDDYQGGDSGLGYLTSGIAFSYPLDFVSEGLGSWDVHGGVSLYYVPDDYAPGNPDEFFLTYSLGIGIGF